MSLKFLRWANDPDKVLSWMEQYDLPQLLHQSGGLVKISNFLPDFAARGALEVLEGLREEDWKRTEAKRDAEYNNINHKFLSSKKGRNLPELLRIISVLQVTCSRDIAVIYYLTKDWKEENGGALVDVETGKSFQNPEIPCGESQEDEDEEDEEEYKKEGDEGEGEGELERHDEDEKELERQEKDEKELERQEEDEKELERQEEDEKELERQEEDEKELERQEEDEKELERQEEDEKELERQEEDEKELERQEEDEKELERQEEDEKELERQEEDEKELERQEEDEKELERQEEDEKELERHEEDEKELERQEEDEKELERQEEDEKELERQEEDEKELERQEEDEKELERQEEDEKEFPVVTCLIAPQVEPVKGLRPRYSIFGWFLTEGILYDLYRSGPPPPCGSPSIQHSHDGRGEEEQAKTVSSRRKKLSRKRLLPSKFFGLGPRPNLHSRRFKHPLLANSRSTTSLAR
ncbi:hypothetical protein GUITHDRAFT_147009 [Guillardia theta CCMP2712]|uniref:Uncharacterized protein n=1 Tax=Guillardia theta (strain CCMP2712) TaxID=905079 RepID=L1IEM4_GUITC|nr:hypothetical protein GUITHDRAFT_147009 [Guillardia theta CCMP2712]EKX34688.1 hypothetical protein GUITHDRAFT_147009 [Guillardia theta CCMP2712]|eukprot:XP_005821668.1 hypothetical protein GUITHDRAFT_147009 [Guillardia theta CCMP2712]